MKQIVMAAAVLSAVALGTGCVSKPAPAPLPPPPSADQVSVLREQYTRAFPSAKIGVVSIVLDDQPYLTVNDINTADLKTGDLVSIIDSSETVIAYGTVEKVMSETSVAVRFDEGRRRPAAGDVAVKF